VLFGPTVPIGRIPVCFPGCKFGDFQVLLSQFLINLIRFISFYMVRLDVLVNWLNSLICVSSLLFGPTLLIGRILR